MSALEKRYQIKLNIPKFIEYLIPKFIKRKISKKFFSYYFLLTNYQKLPLSNYVNINNLEKQKDLIEKFNINQKQNSFIWIFFNCLIGYFNGIFNTIAKTKMSGNQKLNWSKIKKGRRKVFFFRILRFSYFFYLSYYRTFILFGNNK